MPWLRGYKSHSLEHYSIIYVGLKTCSIDDAQIIFSELFIVRLLSFVIVVYSCQALPRLGYSSMFSHTKRDEN